MKISWFIPHIIKLPLQKWNNYDRVMASVWIRCLQLIPFFKKMGIESQINTCDRSTQVAVFLRRWDSDMQKLALEMKKNGIIVIVDTPVNYFSSQDLPPFNGQVKKDFNSFINIADAVFCPSPYIAEFGERLGFKTYCLPDSINVEHFNLKKKSISSKTKPVLIWSGVKVKSQALNFLAPAILKHSWEMVIISEKPPELNFKYSFVKWSYKTFPKVILQGDIGIFPRLIEDEYDKGHSFFKIGVFLAQHIPVICSTVPSYNAVLTNSNSVCPSTLKLEEWEQSIISMYNNKEKVCFTDNPVEQYSTVEIAKIYNSIFKEMVS